MSLMTNSAERQIQLENILAEYDPRRMADEDFDSMRKAIEELESILVERYAVERDARTSAAETKPVTIVTGRRSKS